MVGHSGTAAIRGQEAPMHPVDTEDDPGLAFRLEAVKHLPEGQHHDPMIRISAIRK